MNKLSDLYVVLNGVENFYPDDNYGHLPPEILSDINSMLAVEEGEEDKVVAREIDAGIGASEISLIIDIAGLVTTLATLGSWVIKLYEKFRQYNLSKMEQKVLQLELAEIEPTDYSGFDRLADFDVSPNVALLLCAGYIQKHNESTCIIVELCDVLGDGHWTSLGLVIHNDQPEMSPTPAALQAGFDSAKNRLADFQEEPHIEMAFKANGLYVVRVPELISQVTYIYVVTSSGNIIEKVVIPRLTARAEFCTIWRIPKSLPNGTFWCVSDISNRENL